MSRFEETLLSPENRPQLVRECADLVDAEVDAKGGLSGLALKTAFKAIKVVKTEVVERGVSALLDAWVAEMGQHFQLWEAAKQPDSFGAYCREASSAVAESLLSVTDARIQKADPRLAGIYEKLRPSAREHVQAAVPQLGVILDRYL